MRAPVHLSYSQWSFHTDVCYQTCLICCVLSLQQGFFENYFQWRESIAINVARLRFYCLADPLCVDISCTVWSYLGQAVQSNVHVCVRGSFSCDVHKKKNKKKKTCNNRYFRLCSTTLAVAHDLRIYFGPTLGSQPVIATLGHRAETLHNRSPRPRCPLPQRRIRQIVEQQHAGVLRRQRRRGGTQKPGKHRVRALTVCGWSSDICAGRKCFVSQFTAAGMSQCWRRLPVVPQYACVPSWWKPVKVVFICVRVSLTEHQHRAGCRRSCCVGEKSETGERPKTFYPVIKQTDQCKT